MKELPVINEEFEVIFNSDTNPRWYKFILHAYGCENAFVTISELNGSNNRDIMIDNTFTGMSFRESGSTEPEKVYLVLDELMPASAPKVFKTKESALKYIEDLFDPEGINTMYIKEESVQ